MKKELQFVDTSMRDLAFKEARNGAIVIGRNLKDTTEKPVILHYYKGNYYTHYGMKVDERDKVFSELDWHIFSPAEETTIPAIEFMHKMNDGYTKMVDYSHCNKTISKDMFNKDCFDYAVNKQMVIVNTTMSDYMLNIVRLLYTVKYALNLEIYNHIYVFIKDDELYKDTAKAKNLADIFQVSSDSKITFITVKEGANCIGFFGNLFDLKEGNRILRIYDQRVTDNVNEDDIISHYYHAQQGRDDCIYFHSIYEDMNNKNFDPYDIRNISWTDISTDAKDIDLMTYYHKTLLNLMDTVTNGIKRDDNRVETDVNYSVLYEI